MHERWSGPPGTRGAWGPARRAAVAASLGDEELLGLARAGAPDALAELYLRYGALARRYASGLVPAHEVDDLVSESFAKMLQALRGGRGPADNPGRYLMVVVRTTASSFRQREGRSRPAEGLVRAVELIAVDDPPTDETLAAALGSLRPRWRQIVWWTTVDGWTPVQLGRQLGLSPSAAAALSYRARRALREAYLALLDEETALAGRDGGRSAGALRLL